MAKIDIFPISIGNYKAPLNLIDQILNTNNYDSLVYPIDLVSNPFYCHSIQFQIYDIEYPNIEEAYRKIQPSVKNIPTDPKELLKSSKEGATNILNTLKGVTPSSIGTTFAMADIFQSSNFTYQKSTDVKASISLYMPDTLTTSYDSDYTSLSLTSTFGLAGYLANAAADPSVKSVLEGRSEYSNILNTEAGKTLGALAGGAATGFVGGNAGEATSLFQQALKVVPNPQLQLIYKGIGLREFQFEFIFTPVSAQEAEAVDQIIKTFEYYSLPATSTGGSISQYLIPPQLFTIKFAYTGSQGVLGQVGNVFQNTLNNLIGSSILNGNPTNEINNNNRAKLFTIGECVLSNITVDYAPNGWAAYQDGHPVQTRLTLQFKEMMIRTKNNIRAEGFKGQGTLWQQNPNNLYDNPMDIMFK